MLSREEIMSLSPRQLQKEAELLRLPTVRFIERDGVLMAVGPNGDEEEIPDYPNDLMAAWELVEEMHGKGEGGFTLFRFTTNWRAAPRIVLDPLIDSSDMIEGETAPLAITRAFIYSDGGSRPYRGAADDKE